MGTFDISRINFTAAKHYSSVRMQQGRVLTDDDWNENERIEDYDERNSLVDIIGPYGSPDNGFKIEPIPGFLSLIDTGKINFLIKAGTLYLGGLRLELEADEKYRLQKDWLLQPPTSDLVPVFNETERYDLVYIEAWQQPVSAVEDSSLFEQALGGPDTTTRVKNMRRVRLATGVGTCSCADAWSKLIADWKNTQHLGLINDSFEREPDTKLTVSFTNTGLPDDLCSPAIAGGYLGAENQAIRVQIIDGTNFNWGFDNASPYYRISLVEGQNKFMMLTEPKDQYHWPTSNQVVEILPWSAVLPNGEKVAEEMGHLTKVSASYDPDNGTFTIVDPLPVGFGEEWKLRGDINPPAFFYLHVWNRGSDLATSARIPITAGNIPLGNTGLQISFSGTDRVPNDYWVIAARPTDPNAVKPNRVVPWDLESGAFHHGVKRFFAPLAIIHWTHPAGAAVSGEIVHDCRKKFHPLSEQECCCTFTVGDGKRSHGDFDSIQEAVESLPGDGGKICVLPGEHFADVSIIGKRQVRISGCGDQSIVMPGKQRPKGPVFLIQNSQRIQIDQLTIAAFDAIAIEVKDSIDSKMFTEQVMIRDNRILAGIYGIKIGLKEDVPGNNTPAIDNINMMGNANRGDNAIGIIYNMIGIIDKVNTENVSIGKEAIFSIADGVLIERNRIVVVPDTRGSDPDDPRDPGDPNDGDPFDPCPKPPAGTLRPGLSIRYQIYRLLRYIGLYHPTGVSEKVYRATGGIKIGGTSERVHIKANEIIGGSGNGITLGHLDEENKIATDKLNVFYSALYEINIEENTILQMGLSGISSILNLDLQVPIPIFVTTTDITIYRNLIRLCARQLPLQEPENEEQKKFQAFGGVVLCDCEDGKIQENRIEENGQKPGLAICGVFVMQGQRIDVSTNYIFNNGLIDLFDDKQIRPGHRGGIVVQMAFKTGGIKEMVDSKTPFFDGIPAINIHDNVVLQPTGFAVYLIAFGPVSIVNNQFTSLGMDRSNIISFIATTVFIFNLGLSKDLFLFGLLYMANYNTTYSSGYSSAFSLDAEYLPNGKIMYCGNQTTLDMRSPAPNFSLCSQFIGSLDDIGYNTNQSECVGALSGDSILSNFNVALVDTFLFAFTIRSNDNRFSEGISITFLSLLSIGFLNLAIGNEATHCLIVLAFKGLDNLLQDSLNLILIAVGPCANKRLLYGNALGYK